MATRYDCAVCYGSFLAHEVERVSVGGFEAFVCLEACSTLSQEAREIESADAPPFEAPAECGKARGLFGGLMRAFRKAA